MKWARRDVQHIFSGRFINHGLFPGPFAEASFRRNGAFWALDVCALCHARPAIVDRCPFRVLGGSRNSARQAPAASIASSFFSFPCAEVFCSAPVFSSAARPGAPSGTNCATYYNTGRDGSPGGRRLAKRPLHCWLPHCARTSCVGRTLFPGKLLLARSAPAALEMRTEREQRRKGRACICSYVARILQGNVISARFS